MGQNNFPHVLALINIILAEAWWIVIGSVDYSWRYCGFRFENFRCAGISATWVVYGSFSTFEFIFWLYSFLSADNFFAYKNVMALLGVILPLGIFGIPTVLFILSWVYDDSISDYDTYPNFTWIFAISIGLWFIYPVSHLFLLDDGYSIMYWRQHMMRSIGVTGVRPASMSNNNSNIAAPRQSVRVVVPQ